MPVPEHVHENAALFCSLMLTARAGKNLVTATERRGEERRGEEKIGSSSNTQQNSPLVCMYLNILLF